MMHANHTDNSEHTTGTETTSALSSAARMSPAAGASPAAGTGRPRTWRRAMVASSLLVVISGISLVAVPSIVMGTGFRDQALNSAVSSYGLSATSLQATGGWFVPVSFQDVEIRDQQGNITCEISELRTSKGLLSYFTDGGDLGELTFVHPRVAIHVGEDGQWPVYSSPIPAETQCDFRIEDGEFVLTVPWRKVPIVDLDGLGITGRVRKDENGQRFLTIDPCQIADKMELSDEHAEQNLALIAPVLSQSTRISGSASVWMDRIHMPLDSADGKVSPFPIRGRAEFHSLEASLREEWARQIAQLTGQLTGKQLPSQITVAQQSTVAYEVTETGIHHEGMVFLLPEIASDFRVQSQGAILLDETLDLTLDIKVPELPAGDNPLIQMLGQIMKAPISVRVAGTVSEPELRMPAGLDVLSELSRRVSPETHTDQAPPVANAIIDVIRSGSQTDKEEVRKDLPGSIFGLIRAISDEKSKEKDRPRSEEKGGNP